MAAGILTATSFDGQTVNSGAYRLALMPLASASAAAAAVTDRQRTNQVPVTDYITYQPRDWSFILSLNPGGGGNLTTFRTFVNQYFTPYGGKRTLLATHPDGSTALSASVTVTSLMPGREGRTYTGTFHMDDPIWRSSSATFISASSSPYTVPGTYKALVQVKVTGTTTTLKRRRITITDTSGRGLANYIVRATFDSTGVTATATTNYIVFYQGRSIPFFAQALNGASTTVDFRVDVAPSGSATADIYYGSSVSNSVTNNVLEDGGQNLASASWSNTNWVWDDFSIDTFPAAAGVWRPGKIGQTIDGVSYGMSAVSASSVTFAVKNDSSLANDADCMILTVGSQAGTTSALSGLSRAMTVTSTCRGYVKYRTARSALWQTAWSTTGTGTTTTAIDLDNAVQIAAGIEPTSSTADGNIVLSASGTFQLALASTPTVSAAAAVTARYLDAALTSGAGDSIDFDKVYFDDNGASETFVIDCYNRTISLTTGPLYTAGTGITFSNADDWWPLAPGSFSWTNPTNATVALIGYARYAL